MISIYTNTYIDEGSTFSNINGVYGAIVSCYGCLIKMKNTKMMNINAFSGGLIALVGFCDVQLNGIQAKGISVQMKVVYFIYSKLQPISLSKMQRYKMQHQQLKEAYLMSQMQNQQRLRIR
ncbi:UNKNOWN [Stylonychia lemnae]|uniref:Uncharacterized protein n=1 Tax=Stylonychia lemnae TaxID=5949 RepID=A0A078ATP9_STYLE|nr:UNKNOWN [Stylonychia lemnae]|eukprot:CDW85619.1 UNKNOWN [Stylonychia lemnae]